MRVLHRVVHGSPDSSDVDLMLLVDRLPTQQEQKEQELLHPNTDLNYAVVGEEGAVLDVLHGLPDEVHCQLRRTARGEEPPPQLSRSPPQRCVELKLVACVQKLLVCTRRIPKHRSEVVEALRRNDVAAGVRALRGIRFADCADSLRLDLRKVVAFQLAQTLALTQGLQLYTKGELCEFAPRIRPLLYREEASADLSALDELSEQLFSLPLKLQRHRDLLTVTLAANPPVTMQLQKNRVRLYYQRSPQSK